MSQTKQIKLKKWGIVREGSENVIVIWSKTKPKVIEKDIVNNKIIIPAEKESYSRASVNVSFNIPEKRHLQIMAKIIDILYKEQCRDFVFLEVRKMGGDGFLEFNPADQPIINPKKMKAIRKSYVSN